MLSRRRCCCVAGVTVTILTGWCTDLVAPGTITVTIRAGSSSGAVVASGTAGANGRFVAHLTAGTYYVSASTTSSGYSNTARTFTVVTTALFVHSTLFPSTMQVTDSKLGVTCTMGSPTPDGGRYDGTVSYSYPGCAACGAQTVTLHYSYQCNYPPTAKAHITVSTTRIVGPPPCPDPTAPEQAVFDIDVLGTGPPAAYPTAGYPVNQTATANFTGTSPPGSLLAGQCLYEACAAGTNTSTTYTVTQ